MNRISILITLFVLILSSDVFASRANTAVMGTGEAGFILNGGSFFYDDAYNIFYNPAYVNDFKNWAIIEKSNFPRSTAQGGFVTSIANLTFGLYMNRGNEVVLAPGLAGPAGSYSSTTVLPLRPIELFLGGDMGFKWGLSLGWAANNSVVGNSSDVLLNLGAEFGSLEPFGAIKLQGSDPAGSHNFYRLGTRYKWGEWVPYVALAYYNDSTILTAKQLAWGLGLGRTAKIADGVRMNYALSYFTSSASGSSNSTRYVFPIDFAVEGDAAPWITLRAGLGYRALDRTDSTSAPDGTTGRFGATVHVNKIDFEWAVGKNLLSTAEGASDLDTQSIDIANGFFSTANLTYHW